MVISGLLMIGCVLYGLPGLLSLAVVSAAWDEIHAGVWLNALPFPAYPLTD